ncbi:MAG TPA: hypothetical protein VGP95_09215 [Gemmatimonadaceae bacterium]|nr:hypothetical protein [Gemmatimonadaceae bacterium]
MRLSRWLLAALIPIAACDDLTGLLTDPDAPANLTYQLTPSGNANAPLAVLLSWDVPRNNNANAFNIYGRVGGGEWQLRGTTTSNTFHDAGVPDVQYYVASIDLDGNELARSNTVTIDLHANVPAPTGFTSVSLNGAIQLAWSSSAVDALHGAFDHYRVYSTPYDDSRGVCTATWVLEGTTASDGFFVGNLTNGVSRCFAVSTVTHDGHESVWTEARLDTPRFDARNAFVYSTASRPDSSGFLFFDDASRKLGVVTVSSRADLDFMVVRHNDGTLWFQPARAGATMGLYANAPVNGLTSIDRAPSTGYSSATIQAVPGFAYVFRVQKADGVHFAAARVAYVATDYVVFDWSYQSAVGNAELSRIPLP